MKLIIFSVYDAKAQAYLPPFFLPNRPMAIRNFGDCLKNKKHAFGVHPEDYTMFEIGEFNDNTAEIHLVEGGPWSQKGIELVGNQPSLGQEDGKISQPTPIQPDTKG